MKITMKSQMSGVEHTMEIGITPEQYEAYRLDPNRPLIQRAFPNLSADEREFLMTGTTAEEWDTMFPRKKVPVSRFTYKKQK